MENTFCLTIILIQATCITVCGGYDERLIEISKLIMPETAQLSSVPSDFTFLSGSNLCHIAQEYGQYIATSLVHLNETLMHNKVATALVHCALTNYCYELYKKHNINQTADLRILTNRFLEKRIPSLVSGKTITQMRNLIYQECIFLSEQLIQATKSVDYDYKKMYKQRIHKENSVAQEVWSSVCKHKGKVIIPLACLFFNTRCAQLAAGCSVALLLLGF